MVLKTSLWDCLNKEQQLAVLHEKGPAVVFAGAGSGKTRVITTRILRLIQQGIKPQEILAVTFTNKAAKEMRERVELHSLEGRFVHIGTFHASCARWLREFAEELGYNGDFTIYDDKDSQQLLKKVLEDLQLDGEASSLEAYKYGISQAKTLGLAPKDIDGQRVAEELFPKMGSLVYRTYQERLFQCHAMDFSDLILNMLLLLKNHISVRNVLQERYQYILVDEYQDTNAAQFSLLSFLLGEKQNLFVVGDDDQSIYSWRGADPANILNFKKIFPQALEIRLEQNYRSTGCIIGAANALISNNTIRARKKIWTSNNIGEKIEFHRAYDGAMEAAWVARRIFEEKNLFSYEKIAIFYRTNAQSRQIEDALRHQQIPHKIYGSLRFYDRTEIKDLVAYLRVLVNPKDDVALKRIINVPHRGIGKKALETLESFAYSQGLSLMEALFSKSFNSSKKVLDNFCDLMELLKKLSLQLCLGDFFPKLLEEIEYKKYLQEKFPLQATDKLNNIHELGSALGEYQASKGAAEASLQNWLHDVALYSGSDGQDDQEEKDSVHLMTLHAAKGLEFPRVYLLGVEDGILPHGGSLDSKDRLEEERRLFYVGLTRAKSKMTLLAAQNRRMFNHWTMHAPSRFLKEIPGEFMIGMEKSPKASETFSSLRFSIGDRVKHTTYGSGVIRGKEGKVRDGEMCLVQFQDHGLRRVISSGLRNANKDN